MQNDSSCNSDACVVDLALVRLLEPATSSRHNRQGRAGQGRAGQGRAGQKPVADLRRVHHHCSADLAVHVGT